MRHLILTFGITGLAIASLASADSGLGENEIQAIPFETIPDGVSAVAAGGITLDANVSVSQGITAGGAIQAAAVGFQFPDGTIQSTAAISTIGTTANSGLYGNTIADITPPLPFTEICLKQGQVLGDIHIVSEGTTGGSCEPGDIGWIIERDQRSATTWDSARIECLLIGMRLPELFEWLYSCNNAALFGLNDMEGDWEWSSNSLVPRQFGGVYSGGGVSTAGNPTCRHGGWGWAPRHDGTSESLEYRCIR